MVHVHTAVNKKFDDGIPAAKLGALPLQDVDLGQGTEVVDVDALVYKKSDHFCRVLVLNSAHEE